jgi:hypothetical protein
MVSQPLGQNAQFVIQECIKLELRKLRDLRDVKTPFMDLDFRLLPAGNVAGMTRKGAGFSVVDIVY